MSTGTPADTGAAPSRVDMSLDDCIKATSRSRGGAGSRMADDVSGPRDAARSARRAARRARQQPRAPVREQGESGTMSKGFRVYVTGFPVATSERTVREMFLRGSGGNIIRCQCGREPASGRPTGTFEIVYDRQGDAERAVHVMNNVTFDGLVIRVKFSGLAFFSKGRLPPAAARTAPRPAPRGGKPAPRREAPRRAKRPAAPENLDDQLQKYMSSN